MLIEKPAIDALLPHAGAMCLLDGVVDWDASSIQCTTRSHCRPDNPLRCQQGLSALHGVEYGAQAMAIHGALLQQADIGPDASGYLASIRDLTLEVDWLHDVDGPLLVSARLEVDDGRYLVHRFRIEAGSGLLLSGRAMVFRGSSG